MIKIFDRCGLSDLGLVTIAVVVVVVVVTLGASHAVFAYDPSCGTGPGLRRCNFPSPPPPVYRGGPSYNYGDDDGSPQQQAHNLNERGNKCYQKMEFECAIKSYEQALRLSPNDNVIRNNLAEAKRANAIAMQRWRQAEALRNAQEARTKKLYELESEVIRNRPDLLGSISSWSSWREKVREAIALWEENTRDKSAERHLQDILHIRTAELDRLHAVIDKSDNERKDGLKFGLATADAVLAYQRGDLEHAAALARQAIASTPNPPNWRITSSSDVLKRLLKTIDAAKQAQADQRATEQTATKQRQAEQQRQDAIDAEQRAAAWRESIRRDAEQKAEAQRPEQEQQNAAVVPPPKVTTPEPSETPEKTVTYGSGTGSVANSNQNCLGGTPMMNGKCEAAPNLAPSNEATVTNPDAGSQASSAKKEGANAADAKDPDEARKLAGLQFDTAPTQKGDTLGAVVLGPAGQRLTYVRKSVFPAFSNDADWQRLQSAPAGRDLINKADEQLRAIAAAEAASNIANKAGVQSEMDAAYAKVKALRDGLQTFQDNANKIIIEIKLEGDKAASDKTPVNADQ